MNVLYIMGGVLVEQSCWLNYFQNVTLYLSKTKYISKWWLSKIPSSESIYLHDQPKTHLANGP